MPAGVDRIDFDASEDWELAANVVRNAQLIGKNSHVPIPAFRLGLDLYTDYVAVVATTTSGKPTWQFAGDINQVYNFPKGEPSSILGQIQPARTRLFINKMQLVDTGRVSLDTFDLKYSPPYWFKDCGIRVYKYVGEVKNFVEDTLFDIGNALGIDPNNPQSEIADAIATLQENLNVNITELNAKLDSLDNASEDTQLQLLEQINQLDAGVYTLAEGLADLLPQQRGNEIKQQTQNRLNLDLGFL